MCGQGGDSNTEVGLESACLAMTGRPLGCFYSVMWVGTTRLGSRQVTLDILGGEGKINNKEVLKDVFVY